MNATVAERKKISSDTELEILFKISQVIQSCTETEKSFDSAIELLEELVDFDYAALFIYDNENDRLEVAASKGHVVDLIQPVSFDIGNGLSAWVAKQKRPILLSDIHRGRIESGVPVRSFLSIPLLVGERLIGVMNFGHTEPGTLNQENLKILSIAAAQLSIIIERTLYFSKLSETNRQLENSNRKLREAQKALVDSERLAAIGEVAVTVNHEINNPLTVIIGNAEFLLRDLGDTAEKKVVDKVQHIISEGRRIAKITRALRKIDHSSTEDYLPGGARMLSLGVERS